MMASVTARCSGVVATGGRRGLSPTARTRGDGRPSRRPREQGDGDCFQHSPRAVAGGRQGTARSDVHISVRVLGDRGFSFLQWLAATGDVGGHGHLLTLVGTFLVGTRCGLLPPVQATIRLVGNAPRRAQRPKRIDQLSAGRQTRPSRLTGRRAVGWSAARRPRFIWRSPRRSGGRRPLSLPPVSTEMAMSAHRRSQPPIAQSAAGPVGHPSRSVRGS
jgi:hypothetical protein